MNLNTFSIDESTLQIDPTTKEEQLNILKTLQVKAAKATSYNKDVELFLIKRRTILNTSEFNKKFTALKTAAKIEGKLTAALEQELKNQVSQELSSLYNELLKKDKEEVKKGFQDKVSAIF